MKTIEIKIIETVTGNKPQEQIEFLSLTCNEVTKQTVAYNKGNGYIKLFTYQDFLNFYCLDNDYISIDISLDLYNDDEAFEDFVQDAFFSDKETDTNCIKATVFQCYKREFIKGETVGEWTKTHSTIRFGENATSSMLTDGSGYYIDDPDNRLQYFVNMKQLNETNK